MVIYKLINHLTELNHSWKVSVAKWRLSKNTCESYASFKQRKMNKYSIIWLGITDFNALSQRDVFYHGMLIYYKNKVIRRIVFVHIKNDYNTTCRYFRIFKRHRAFVVEGVKVVNVWIWQLQNWSLRHLCLSMLKWANYLIKLKKPTAINSLGRCVIDDECIIFSAWIRRF